MEDKKEVKLAFKLVAVEEQKRYVASVMASLQKNFLYAKTDQAKVSIQQKIDYYGSIYHSLEGVGGNIKRIYKPSKFKVYVSRLINSIARGKKEA
ncbi:hypothetical protein [Acetobacteroides hydrogenigenes]|uniref:Uncharacterized protein n=1 Tax=Acetobacteroides hydrogenigenes TaxID=979970 RepID=A0A4V6NLU5_9BACT|nr:hypothetical protein [Acetobacteroides hydrogenigenes]TCN63710.1 hypothetical protein CLV25_11560 [Acetobacteroides hydrogenigenes]